MTITESYVRENPPMPGGAVRADLAVFVVAVGDIDYRADALAVLTDYFARNRVNLFVLNDGGGLNYYRQHPSWLKLLAHRYVSAEFILTWDLDLLPNGTEFSLPSHIDRTRINACWDSSLVFGHSPYRDTFRYNGGLLGIPRSEAAFMASIYDERGTNIECYPSWEQYHLNDELAARGYPVHELPNVFNLFEPCGGVRNHSEELLHAAVNTHYTGAAMGNRASLIRQHRERYFQRVNGGG